ncbi:helix-turn-helix domain-containing protein [Actinocrispum sp. NPDC049592]|uniref:AfsR/SARP family transcriptional regulator n=1 Tax=Actinocrispum sp. NPDC049592 TaxID=3154835 RepID=UPI0034145094
MCIGDEPVDAGPVKQRGLLAVQPNQVVTLEEIVDMLWGGEPLASYTGLVQPTSPGSGRWCAVTRWPPTAAGTG